MSQQTTSQNSRGSVSGASSSENCRHRVSSLETKSVEGESVEGETASTHSPPSTRWLLKKDRKMVRNGHKIKNIL